MKKTLLLGMAALALSSTNAWAEGSTAEINVKVKFQHEATISLANDVDFGT